MTSGMEVSSREKRFVSENKNRLFPAQLAKELASRFPVDNGGFRSKRTVKQLLKSTD